MTDPLSITAGAAGLLGLGIQTANALVEFYTAYRNQSAAIARAAGRLQSVLGALRSLDQALQSRKFRLEEKHMLQQIESNILQCEDLIHELQGEYQKFGHGSSGSGAAVKAAGRRVTYPFRQSTLQKLDEDISDVLENISLALEVLHLRDDKSIQDDITAVKSLVELIRATQISTSLRRWLKAPDPSIEHNAACAKRHPGTGTWHVKGSNFESWLTEHNSFLWLHGFAGCGKTVLCSTSVLHALRHRRGDGSVGIAVFYFTFRDETKRDELAMLRALILQVTSQLSDGNDMLLRLCDRFKSGDVPNRVLLETLQQVTQRFSQIYIFLDALDETIRYQQRDRVLGAIQTMRAWSLPGLHMLVTSRDEADIRDSLNPAKNQEVSMRNSQIDQDINEYISGQLSADPTLQRWEQHHNYIQTTLAERAHGVFRWAECQLLALKRCPRSKKHLRQCLRSLPRDLDDTYRRMLCSIDDESAEEARKILTLLCFSARPLTAKELIDAIAVDTSEPGGLDPQSRLSDADSLLEICPGLIKLTVTGERRNQEWQEMTVQIAHYSVQEYLESGRIKDPKAARYALSSAPAHAEIARICCLYLLEPRLPKGPLTRETIKQFTLAPFAAQYWHQHHCHATSAQDQLEELVLRLFTEPDVFRTWSMPDSDAQQRNWRRVGRTITPWPPLYYASWLNLERVVQALTGLDQAGHPETQHDVNAVGGYYGTALGAASIRGHEAIVQLLLDAGADINGGNGSALSAASAGGHEAIVQHLLDVGADVNAQGGVCRTALIAASNKGHEAVVQQLLDAGADVNGDDGRALEAASAKGYETIVQQLLDAGVDITGAGSDALHFASSGGHEAIVRKLLDAGADLGEAGDALNAASAQGHAAIVQHLLGAGVDVNGEASTALSCASAGGHEAIVQTLLDDGADVNAQDGYFGTALIAASTRGHKAIVHQLLDAGADINAYLQNRYGDETALTVASRGGHEATVRQLLDAGADVDPHIEGDGTALIAASTGGHEAIVQQLLDAGADVNAQCGRNKMTALITASWKGHEVTVQKLLDAGADVAACIGGGYGGENALLAASREGHEAIVQKLLDAGADVNASLKGRFGVDNALLAASREGHEAIVQKLLDAGADVTACIGGRYGGDTVIIAA